MTTWKVGDRCYVKAQKRPNGNYRLADIPDQNEAHGYNEKVAGKVHKVDMADTILNVMVEFDPSEHSVEELEGAFIPGKTHIEIEGCKPDKKYRWTHCDCLLPRSGGTTTINRGRDEVVFSCCECGNGAPMAAANLSDGRFACYSCRNGGQAWKYRSLLKT